MTDANHMTDDMLLVTRPDPGVCVLRLNRPQVRNALNIELRGRLAEAFLAVQQDTAVRCVVIGGSEKAFCAGADLNDYVDATTPEIVERRMERTWDAMRTCPVPVIAAVRGYALGGGCEIALSADIVIAGQNATFGQPEILVGLMPGGGATQRLVRAVGKAQTMDLLLTGRRFSANEALAMGVLSRVVDDGSVESTAMELALQIARGPSLATRMIKEAVLQGEDSSLEIGLAFERKCFQILFSSTEKHEGIRAFLDKRKPTFG